MIIIGSTRGMPLELKSWKLLNHNAEDHKLVRAECVCCPRSAGINAVAIVLGIISLSSSP